MKTLIIIPAYNEARNLPEVIKQLRRYVPELDFIIINDASNDSTREFLLLDDYIQFLDLPVNLGIGGAMQAGYIYADKNNYDIAIQFDGDGQHKAEYIRDLILPIMKEDIDVVIGSRFLNRKGFQSSAMRRIGITFISVLIKFLTGVTIKDTTSGFRAVNKKMIKVFARNYPQDYPEPEAILETLLEKSKIKEIPVEMQERKQGKSSISGLFSVYYMLKVSIALIVYRFLYVRDQNEC